MAAPLALPPSSSVLERTRPRNALVVGAALYGLAVLTFTAALIGAYTAFRSGVRPWPPEGVKKENYFGTLLLGASLMVMVAAEWLVWSVRNGYRRQTVQAAALAAGLLLAMLNAVVFIASEAGYGAGATPYATLFYAFLVIAGLTQIAGLAAIAGGLARFGGRQVSASEPQVARSVSIALHVAALTWVMVWSALYAASK